jgi:hypothetical protein
VPYWSFNSNFRSFTGHLISNRLVLTRVAAGEDSASQAGLDSDAQEPPLAGDMENSMIVEEDTDVVTNNATIEEVDMRVEPRLEDGAPETVGTVAKLRNALDSNPVAGYSILGIVGFLGFTFVIAVVKTTAKGFTKKGRRTKTVNKNKMVIDELNRYLPDNRDGLKGSSITGIRLRTGFSPTEIFRKYLWYLLRERKFDNDALADVIELKKCLNLSEGEVAAALQERAERIFDKYGTVMLDTSGMSPAGVERKATARALFSKMLYLVECDDVLGSEERSKVDLRDIFGATEDDVARLRIASLYEVDLDAVLNMPSAEIVDNNEDKPTEE